MASGLDHSAVIEYTPTENISLNDRVVVTVDGEVIDVPIHALPQQPVLQMEREVNLIILILKSFSKKWFVIFRLILEQW